MRFVLQLMQKALKVVDIERRQRPRHSPLNNLQFISRELASIRKMNGIKVDQAERKRVERRLVSRSFDDEKFVK
jgi:hypothetical protein